MSQKKVLVVDDDPGIRDVLQSILETDGVEVLTASDGEEGLQKAVETNPDLILLDIGMPKVDGLTFCMAVQSMAITRRIPIIVITGQTNSKKARTCVKAGADDFLVKPLQIDELLACVEAMFRTSHIPDSVERLHEYIFTVRDLRGRLSEATKSAG